MMYSVTRGKHSSTEYARNPIVAIDRHLLHSRLRNIAYRVVDETDTSAAVELVKSHAIVRAREVK